MKNSVIYKNLLFGILTILASSCEKIIEPKDLPEQDPRLVLNSVMETDSLIKANLTVSKSIISGKDYKIIDDAVCDLYINGLFSERLKNNLKGNYISTKSAKTNNSYLLKVSASGYKNVEGGTTIPGALTNIRGERYDSTNSFFSRSNFPGSTGIFGTIKLKIYIQDNLSTSSYYGISPVIMLYDSLNNEIKTEVKAFITSNTNNGLGGSYSSNGQSLESDDKYLVNGNEVLFDAGVNLSTGVSGNVRPHFVAINFIVSCYSEDLYKYKVTLNQQSSVNGGLFSEPVLVHSNIVNGMGIVGSINSQTISAVKVSIR